MNKLIGLAGGIGSGKSTASQVLRTLGYAVYDTDQEAKRLMGQDDVLKQALCESFGAATYEEGQLNRAYLATLVFPNPERLAQLNAIVHPAVIRDLRSWAAQAVAPVVFVESAILFQAGLDQVVDEVWLVVAPLEERIARVEKRDGLCRVQISERIAAQVMEESKHHQASIVLDNAEQQALLPQIKAQLLRLDLA